MRGFQVLRVANGYIGGGGAGGGGVRVYHVLSG